MAFNTFAFAVFIAPTLVLLASLSGRARVFFLIALSYVFYSASYPPWIVLLLICTVGDYWLAILLDRQTKTYRRFIVVALSCGLNLGLLAFFKYAAFFARSFNEAAAAIHLDLSLPVIEVGLPLGISFFVFESLSYVVDVYRRSIAPFRSLADYALFISFFPHLVSGPIVRARDFIPQIAGHRPFDRTATVRGLELVVVGFFKKAVIADNCAPLVETIYGTPSAYGGAAFWLATVLFAMQIYCDFSGYTDIARGLAKMMGFELAQNFDWPYLSRSIRDFWRRWHISLSSWLRDYLYIPLGGSREGPSRTAIAIVLTWFLGGLWHGAAWNFVVWGLYHGVLVSIASWTRRTGAAALWDHIPAPVQIAATFAAVTWGWVLFRSSNLSVAASMWAAMASPWRADFWRGTETFSALGLLLVIAAACTHVATYWLRRNAQATSVWMQWPYPVRAFALGITAFVTFALAGKSQSFIYFRF